MDEAQPRAPRRPLRPRRARRAGARGRARRSWRARIVPDLPDLLAEAPFAARHEQARTLADVLLRRTRLGLLAARELLGRTPTAGARAWPRRWRRELGWDEPRIERELERWRAVARAEGIATAPCRPRRDAAAARRGSSSSAAARS